MKHFFSLLFHECRMLFISSATYIAAVLFLLFMSVLYFIYLNEASTQVQDSLPSEFFFQAFPIPVCFMVPLLTMRSIAEERNLGTLETLMTTPATAFEIVFSKFLSAYFFYIILWGLTLCFPFIVSYFGPGEILGTYLLDKPSLLGGYSFIAISGTLYVAMGIFASSLTRSQLVAGMLSFCLLILFIVCRNLLIYNFPILDTDALTWLETPLDYLHSYRHLEDFSRGVIDTRPFALYLSSALLSLGVTTLVVEAKV